jgi:hypothetical protein
MPKHEEKAAETAAAPPIAVSQTDLVSLLRAAAAQEVAGIFTAKTTDERIRDAIDRQRGVGQPTAQEFLVECRSPITGSTFTARLVASKSPEVGTRVVEMLDYRRPDGWDRKRQDGGIVPDGDDMPLVEANGVPGKRYASWLYENFLKKDYNAVGGKVLPDQWRAAYSPAPGSVTLTPEQMIKLGINPEELKAALGAEEQAAK